MAAQEPQLTRNLSPGLLFTTFPSTRTGSTWSWEKAGLKLARALSTRRSGGHLRGWMGQVALRGQDWQVCEQILQAADRAVPSASWSRCHGGHEDMGLWQG